MGKTYQIPIGESLKRGNYNEAAGKIAFCWGEKDLKIQFMVYHFSVEIEFKTCGKTVPKAVQNKSINPNKSYEK